jgi:hypothetical protein
VITSKVSKNAIGCVFCILAAVLVFVFSYTAWAGADPNWISLAPSVQKAPQTNLLQSDFDQVEFEILIPGIWSEEIATQAGAFSQLTMSHVGASSVIGQPNLPVITRMLQIPFGAEVSVSLVESRFVEKSLQEVGIPNRIAPVQPPIPKLTGAWGDAEFVIDDSYYQKDEFLPQERVRLGEIGVIRGHRFVSVIMNPVSYNPRAQKMRIYTSMKIRLTLSGSDMAATKDQLYRYASPPFEELCEELFVNYPRYQIFPKDAPQLPIGYLLITHQNYYSAALALAEWKARKGFHVTIAQVPQIGSTKEAIKLYIEDAYDNWDIPPTYVLFLGDTYDIPTWTGAYSSSATDIEYVKMDPDYFADIFRGRLPANDATEAADMVSKLLYYENPTAADLEWMGHGCFIASDDAGLTAEYTHRYVIQNYLLPNAMEVDTIWDRLGGSTSDIADCVNGGASIVCYSGHGNTGGWGCVPFYQSDVQALLNQDEYPLVLSHACLTAKFNLYECFGETWVVEANKAGIAFWGASNLSYWDEDDILEKRMFEAAFEETCYSIGSMTDRALYQLYQYYGGGGLSRYYLDLYDLLGDPSVDLWTNPADSLEVDHPLSVNAGSNTVNVTVQTTGALPVPVYGALVCLQKEGEVFETGYTDVSGEITMYPSPLTPGDMNITVTAHNFLPYMSTIAVGEKVGDVTGDGEVNAEDIIYLLNYLYKGGPAPDPLNIGDVNCDGEVNGGDVVYLLNYLFQGGPPPCAS